jgi:uncharacterized membrane protein
VSSTDVANEWNNPSNWGRGVFTFYFSKKDPRLIVPKRRPGLGWTLNMAHPGASLVILAVLLLILLIPVVESVLEGKCAPA